MTETDIHHRQLRDKYPFVWIALTQNRNIPYIIDALLDAQPHRESTSVNSQEPQA